MKRKLDAQVKKKIIREPGPFYEEVSLTVSTEY